VYPCVIHKPCLALKENPWLGGQIKDYEVPKEVLRLFQKRVEEAADAMQQAGGELDTRPLFQPIATLVKLWALDKDDVGFREIVILRKEVSLKVFPY
jgi:hypothetical protein